MRNPPHQDLDLSAAPTSASGVVDLVDAVARAQLPPNVRAPLRALLLQQPGALEEWKKREACRQMDELVRNGASVRQAADIVGRRLDVHPQTVRQRWW